MFFRQAHNLTCLHVIHSDNVAMPPKKLGNIRKRVEQRHPPAPKRARADSIGRPQDASSSSPRPLSGGIRKRVATAQSSADPPPPIDEGGPLTTVMNKEWGKGKVLGIGHPI